jgi:hypothetical protein
MVCSQCNCSGHNKRTCQFLTTITPAEQRVAAELSAMLPTLAEQRVAAELSAILPTRKAKKVSKPLVGLAGSMNIFKEPKVVKAKKVSKPLEGLAGSMNIFKEPKVVKAKKVSKPLEGLAGSMNIFKEPKVVKAKKHLKTCSGCGEKGHNTRTCANVCLPCSPPAKTTRNDAATIIQKYARRMIVLNINRLFPVDPYLTFQTTCHWCGECGEDVTFVKSYSLFGCRECASECGDDY